MAKSGQKRKKAEKAKTQLKTSMKNAGKADKKKKVKGQSGIKLPKGLNETKADVKIKSLVISSQSDKTVVSSSGKRYRELNDLLSKMKHYSKVNRVEALKGLHEIVKDCPDRLNVNLPEVINRLMSLLIDLEPDVRSLSLDITEKLFVVIPANRLSTFSKLIVAHLCCALSHINTSVQRDALRIVDKLIEHVPAFVADHFDRILPSCMEQISDCTGKKLSSGIPSKMTISEWRLNVLRRVEAILELVHAKEDASPALDSNSALATWTMTMSPCEGLYQSPDWSKSLTCDDIGEQFNGKQSTSSKGVSRMDQFSEKLSSLLIESWCEIVTVVEPKKRQGKAKPLNAEQTELLTSIINIQALLLKTSTSNEKKARLSKIIKEKVLDLVIHRLPLHMTPRDDHRILNLNLTIVITYLYICHEPSPESWSTLLKVLKRANLAKLTANMSQSLIQALTLLGQSSSTNVADLDELFQQSCQEAEGEAVSKLMFHLIDKFGTSLDSSKLWIQGLVGRICNDQATNSDFATMELIFKRNLTDALEIMKPCQAELKPDLPVHIQAYFSQLQDKM